MESASGVSDFFHGLVQGFTGVLQAVGKMADAVTLIMSRIADFTNKVEK